MIKRCIFLLALAVLAAACAWSSQGPMQTDWAVRSGTVLPTIPPPSRTPPPSFPLAPTPLPHQTSAPALLTPLTLESPAPASRSFPAPLARIPVGSRENGRVVDMVLDTDANRLYVTDEGWSPPADILGQLHVLDTNTYAELVTLPLQGNLVLDATHHRLYVIPEPGRGSLSVVNTESLSVIANIEPPMENVALDPVRNRLYVGWDPRNLTYPPGEWPNGVRIYDADTLEPLGQIPQAGVPVYNPLRDDLLIVGYSVFAVDLDTLKITGDLLPDITGQVMPGCNGCDHAIAAQVFPRRNLVVVDMGTSSAGKGAGTQPPPRFFDATTLGEIISPAQQPGIEHDCAGRVILQKPLDGRVYRGDTYSRYEFYDNLLVYDLNGQLLTWRDGLALGITNAATNQMYTSRPDAMLVLDLPSMLPAGTLQATCIFTVEHESGRIFGTDGADVVVFAENGGQFEPPPPEPISDLVDPIYPTLPSPDYEHDQTLFIGAGRNYEGPSRIYRSTDAGDTWELLRGGLPEGESQTLDLAISPDYAHDRTLFVGGYWGEVRGYGVYRSTDGGDTWQPMWNGLLYLRVYDVVISPDYAADGTVLAYSRFTRIVPLHGGEAVFRSADRGLHWTEVMTSTASAGLPTSADLLPAGPSLPPLRFRAVDYGQRVERSTDGGATWQPVTAFGEPEFHVAAILPSPYMARDQTVYIVSDYDLFRSTDGGETWERAVDSRLGDLDWAHRLTTGSLTPAVASREVALLIGTANGQFWRLDPAALSWEPVQVAERWPTVLPGEWIRDIEVAPNGDVWLGTWGYGLALYSDGAIQARYSMLDGLPGRYVIDVAVAANGEVWAGCDLPPGVACFDGQKWTVHPLPEEAYVSMIADLEVDPQGRIWAGAEANGILLWDGAGWQQRGQGATGWRINDIAMDPDGTLWCATSEGLAVNDHGNWRRIDVGESTAVAVAPDGTVWLYMQGGTVQRYAGGQRTPLPPPPGEPPTVLELYVATDGAIWTGTYRGAYRYDGHNWQRFTAQDGLPNNEVYDVAEDAQGEIWFATAGGAAHVDPATLDLSPVDWASLPTPAPQQ